MSAVRLLDPELDRYPRWARAVAGLRVAMLHPGDVLVIPPHWWHHVEGFGLNVMINHFYFPIERARWHAIGRNRVDAMAIYRQLAPETRSAYASRYDARVFRLPFDGPSTGAGSRDDAAADGNLDEAARLFEAVPEPLRRHAQLSYRYFAFQTFGPPMAHAPGEHERVIDHLQAKLAAGTPVGLY